MSRDYIPDLTERFPEGFGGVDMTDRYCNNLDDLREMYKAYQEDLWHAEMEREMQIEKEN